MPRLTMPNEVLMEIYRFCTYNDLNTLALTNSQLQTIQLDNAPIARMHCLEVSSQGFTLQYSCNSTRKRLFPTFDDFVSCARKVRPKIHTLQLINMHDSEEEDSCLRKLFSIELYRFCTNLINPLIRLRFYCCGVMHRGLWYHGDVCPYDDDWNRLMHEGHTLKVECFDDPLMRELNATGLAELGLQESSYTMLVSVEFSDVL